MVDIKTRVFHETDNGSIGAEVIVFDDTGNKVKSIQITDQTQFDELVDQLKVIDETYVKENQLLTILSNAQGEINQINATLLSGYKASDFSLNNHNHDNNYARINHATNNPPNDNFIGTDRLFGHVKTINNVTSGNYVAGEALAAYQGKLLNDRINSINPYIYDSGWITFPVDNWNGFYHYSDSQKVQYRRVGKVVHLRGAIKNTGGSLTGGTDGWHIGYIPAGFRPSKPERTLNQGSGASKHLLVMNTDGQLFTARYGTTSANTDIPNNAWLNCFMTYFID